MAEVIDPPEYYFTGVNYNPNFYNQDAGTGITEAEANGLYLRKTVPDTATSVETFNGGIITPSVSSTGALSIDANNNSATNIANGDGATLGDATGAVNIRTGNNNTGTISIGKYTSAANQTTTTIGGATNISTTGGIVNIGTGTSRATVINIGSGNNGTDQGIVNINSGATSLGMTNINSGYNNTGGILIGDSSVGSTQTCVINSGQISIGTVAPSNNTRNITIGATSGVHSSNTALNGKTTIFGATNINTSGTSNTTIGVSGSTTAIIGTTNINTTGTANTTIGASGQTTTIVGTTDINGTSGLATTIGTVATGTTTLRGATNAISATTNTITGTTTNINSLGGGTITIGTISTSSTTLRGLLNTLSATTNSLFGIINLNGTTNNGLITIGNTSVGGITTLSSPSINIGTSGSTNIIVGTTEINGTGGLSTTIGTVATGTNTIRGATNTITGTTNINTSGTSATNIGISASTTTIVGTTNINTTGSSNTTIGNSTGTLTVNGGGILTNTITSSTGATLMKIASSARTFGGNIELGSDGITGGPTGGDFTGIKIGAGTNGIRSFIDLGSASMENTYFRSKTIAINDSGNGNTTIGTNGGTSTITMYAPITISEQVNIGPTFTGATAIMRIKPSSTYVDGPFIGSFNDAFFILQFLNSVNANRGSITGTVSSVAYNTASDRRLKTNIEIMDPMLDKIMSLKPSKYNWKIDNEIGYGFIAQEVHEIFPELRHCHGLCCDNLDEPTNCKTGEPIYYGVDYSKFTPYMVKAFQELKEEYDAKFKVQDEKLSNLEARLLALEPKPLTVSQGTAYAPVNDEFIQNVPLEEATEPPTDGTVIV